MVKFALFKKRAKDPWKRDTFSILTVWRLSTKEPGQNNFFHYSMMFHFFKVASSLDNSETIICWKCMLRYVICTINCGYGNSCFNRLCNSKCLPIYASNSSQTAYNTRKGLVLFLNKHFRQCVIIGLRDFYSNTPFESVSEVAASSLHSSLHCFLRSLCEK